MAKRDRGKPLGHLRRACEDDAGEVETLLNSSNVKLFHCESIGDTRHLIKTCVLSICQLDEDENIIGFLALSDHPRIAHLHPSAWQKYVWARYKTPELTARNTLFIHLLCWSPSVTAKHVASKMLRAVFMHDPYLHFVCILKQIPEVMQLDPEDASVESMFKQSAPSQCMRGVATSKLPALMTLARSEICPRLRIRRAVEEDNDDIVPLVDSQSTRLRELYGDYYISELVSRHPESDRVLLVAEHNEVAVGVMVLNTQIDYEVLQDNFELSPYHGLKRSAASDALATRLHFNTDLDAKPVDGSNNFTRAPGSHLNFHIATPTICLTDGKDKEVFESVPSLESRPVVVSDPQWNYFSLLEEEEQDFDIVNIEGGLLNVPHIFICESDIISPISHASLEETEEDIESVQDLRAKRKPDAYSRSKSMHEFSNRWNSDTRMQYRRFSGKPDAFIIEIFAMHPDCDERHGFDILEVTFEMFPDRCYCVLALPSDHIAYPLLEHFTLVTPHPSRNHLIDQSLYVAHRNSVKGIISVRKAEASDLVVAEKLLKVSARRHEVFEKFHESLTCNDVCSYMLLSEKQPVGFVILGPLEEDRKLHARYAACPGDIVQGMASGVVTEAVLAPALEPHARWFCRELLRHEEYDELFWTCGLMTTVDSMPCKHLISLTARMVPLMPRRPAPEPAQPAASAATESAMDLHSHLDGFGVWHLSRPMTSMPKVDINHSIVVVGASSTGLSFIETLLFGPSSSYLSVTNVTLVSTQGLLLAKDYQRAAFTFIPQTGRYDEAYFKRVPFFFYIDVVEGTMVQIDRKKKCIILHDGAVKYYDDLYLTFGEQFQHPHHLREELEREERMQQGHPCEHSPMDDPDYAAGALPTAPTLPNNVLLINSVVDGQKALKMVCCMLRSVHITYEDDHSSDSLVVYGACVEALTCITALLETGIPAKRIIYVECFPPTDATALRVQHFNDEVVDSRVQDALKDTGVTCYRGYSFIGWTLGSCGDVKSLRLLSRHHVFDMHCVALFYYGGKSIDLHAFAAMNSSGLVYDGGLVVDPQFGTNDPHIFAAGPGTHYSRILHADLFIHGHYRAEDVGAALGEMALSRLDPFHAKVQHCGPKGDGAGSPTWKLAATSDGPQSVPKFKSSIMCYCSLPGGLHYLHVRRPGPEVPAAIAYCMDAQGHTLITDNNGDYFRLELDTHHIVSELTCLSKVQFNAGTLTQLYGKHEQMLNNLLLRYESGMIDDLFAYFSNPWLTAVYRDDFTNLLADIENHDIILGEENLGTIKDIVTKLAEQNYSRNAVNTNIEKTRGFTEKALVEMLTDWLRLRRLPMYALPALPELPCSKFSE